MSCTGQDRTLSTCQRYQDLPSLLDSDHHGHVLRCAKTGCLSSLGQPLTENAMSIARCRRGRRCAFALACKCQRRCCGASSALQAYRPLGKSPPMPGRVGEETEAFSYRAESEVKADEASFVSCSRQSISLLQRGFNGV